MRTTDEAAVSLIRQCIGAAVAIFLAAWLTSLAAPMATGQTFHILHSFTGGADGANPMAGPTLDPGGKLYGTTQLGGNVNAANCTTTCGVVYRIAPAGSGWVLSTLYKFNGADGSWPTDPVLIGSNETLYGTAGGVIYNLKPPATNCRSSNCPWTETILYPYCCAYYTPGGLTFDQQGNLYGPSEFAGIVNRCSGGLGCGYLFKLLPSDQGYWNAYTMYIFPGGSGGAHPVGKLIFDQSGNLYGTTAGLYGGDGYGSVFKFTPSTAQETNLFIFPDQLGDDGSFPTGGLIFDQVGNLYGGTTTGGSGGGGTVFKMTPSDGSWTYNVIHSFTGSGYYPGVPSSLILGPDGSLYGVTNTAGLYEKGSVFKLTPTNGNWAFTSLHDFTGGTDGAYPYGALTMDSNGTLYGTTFAGGNTGPNCANFQAYECGVVFAISQ